jgi:hypothetical protein
VQWINLAKDRDKRMAVVNRAMKFRVPYNSGNLLTS